MPKMSVAQRGAVELILQLRNLSAQGQVSLAGKALRWFCHVQEC